MQLVKRKIDLILPPGLEEASASLLSLCELFVGCLLDAKENTLDLRVDLPNRLVSSNNEKLREIVRLLVGAGRLEDFSSQLISLLHQSPNPCLLGLLLCSERGRVRQFSFQKMGDAYIDWRIITA